MATEPGLAELSQKIADLESKVDKLYASSEKLRKYFLWTGIITAAFIVIPLIAIPFLIGPLLQSITIPQGF